MQEGKVNNQHRLNSSHVHPKFNQALENKKWQILAKLWLSQKINRGVYQWSLGCFWQYDLKKRNRSKNEQFDWKQFFDNYNRLGNLPAHNIPPDSKCN